MVISLPLLDNFMAVRGFEDYINQLYALSDTMNGDAEIVIEIGEQRVQSLIKLKEYRVKRYDQKIDWGFDNGNNIYIRTQPTMPDLYAIPLDCPNDQIQLRGLLNQDNQYVFPNLETLSEFVIFSKNKDVRVQPAFINSDQAKEQINLEEREQCIIALRDRLLKATSLDDDWSKLLSYYLVCENNELPYSTFDILRAVSFSSLLAAKVFVFLTCRDPDQNFNETTYSKIEQDLGFSFHWINKNHWIDAMEWMGCFDHEQLMKEVSHAILSHFENC